MIEAPCIKVRKVLGERALKATSILNLVDRDLKVGSEDDYLLIPLLKEPSRLQIDLLTEELGRFKVERRVFHKKKKFLKPIDLAAEHLPPHLLASFPRSIEFIGQVAIIEFPPELEPYKEILGSSILKAHKNVKTVLAKAGAVKGAYRIRKFEIIAGSENTETVHKEFGCIFRLDPRRVYFSPRLSYEHFRVTSKVNEGENVIDMFAGVGPFSIMIAKKVKRVKVYAIDINPEAIRYLTMNIVLNGVEGKVISMLGDAREIISKRLRGIADRVIMNLPEKASVYLPVACNALKDKGGIIHCYQFARGENAILKAEKIAERIIKNSTYRKHCRILSSRIVREVAPFTWQVAVDLEVK